MRNFIFVFVACLMAIPVSATESGQGKVRGVVPMQVAASESRTLDDVRRVVDKNKGRIYALYVHALRERPDLEGTVVLSISIAPTGRVTKCVVASSTLNDQEFEKRFVEHFASIDFGAKGTKVYSNPEFPMSFFSIAGTSPNKR